MENSANVEKNSNETKKRGNFYKFTRKVILIGANHKKNTDLAKKIDHRDGKIGPYHCQKLRQLYA